MASPDRTTAVQSVKNIYNIRQMSLGHSANKVLSQFWADSTLLFFKQMMHKNDTKSLNVIAEFVGLFMEKKIQNTYGIIMSGIMRIISTRAPV